MVIAGTRPLKTGRMRMANSQTAGKDASVLLRGGMMYQAHYALCKLDLDVYHDSSDDDVNMADV